MAGITSIISQGLSVISKFIPDKDLAAKAAAEYEAAILAADTQLAVAQTDVNKIEAASEDRFTSRARPTIIYICGVGFGYQYIIQPFLQFICNLLGKIVLLPNLDMTSIGTVLLGLCGLRSWDKKR